MRRKLTAKTIDALAATGQKRLEVYDEILPGFGIRASRNSKKVYFCSVRSGGRQRRITIGPHPLISLAGARASARKIMIAARDGTLESKPEVNLTLGEAVLKFIDMYAKPQTKNWRDTEGILKQKFKTLFHRPISSIKRGDIVRILDDMIAQGIPGRANHALSAIKKCLNWCLNRGMIEINPVAGLSPPGKKISRDRILTDGEVSRLIDAANAEGYPWSIEKIASLIDIVTTDGEEMILPISAHCLALNSRDILFAGGRYKFGYQTRQYSTVVELTESDSSKSFLEPLSLCQIVEAKPQEMFRINWENFGWRPISGGFTVVSD